MKKHKIILTILIAIVVVFACKRGSEQPGFATIQSQLIDGPWQLVRSYEYNNQGMVIGKTEGILADSVLFNSAPDNILNVTLVNLQSFIGGIKKTFSFALYKDSLMMISPVWKTGYSDTIFILNHTDTYLTFKIKKISAPPNAYELDSLKKIRFYQ